MLKFSRKSKFSMPTRLHETFMKLRIFSLREKGGIQTNYNQFRLPWKKLSGGH
jgi:hypothetical protein